LPRVDDVRGSTEFAHETPGTTQLKKKEGYITLQGKKEKLLCTFHKASLLLECTKAEKLIRPSSGVKYYFEFGIRQHCNRLKKKTYSIKMPQKISW
jgi:DNA recombination-dependent growth factor C